MKKLFLFSLITLLSMAWQSGYSYNFSASYNGRTFYYNLIYNNDKPSAVELTYNDDYEGLYSGNVVIPSTVTYNGQTLPVTRIGWDAFYNCTDLRSVTIPEGVTRIGENAFYNCNALWSVTIPEGVTRIGENAFYNCYSLTSVTINSDAIMSETYTSSSSLKNIFGYQVKFFIIGEGVTSIGAYAFSGCTWLAGVTIPSSVTSIGNYSFNGCSGLTSVIFEGQVNSIGNIALPTSCIIYVPTGKKAYYQNILGTNYNICERGLYNDIYYVLDKDNHTALICGVYDNTLDEFWLTEQFRLGGVNYTVTDILPNAFQGCRNIKEIYIPETIKQIGANAFDHCTGLTSVTIPSSVTSIGKEAFYGCNNITTVKVPVTDMAAFCNNQVIGLIKSRLKKPVMLIDGEGNEIAEYVIPDGVETISENAFANCKGLTSVTIPSSVTSIGNYAFYYCSGLTKVIVPDIAAWCGISFGSNPLDYAQHLYSDEDTEITNLVIPSSVTSIGDDAFRNCTGLTSVTIPSSVTSIGDDAFRNCTGLTSVTIPSSVTSIGAYAFNDCSGLTSVTIPSSVTSIASSSFSGCSRLTSVTIPEGVTSIGDYAFKSCSGLTSVTIPSSVTSIGYEAFRYCSSLTSVTIPSSVTSIGAYAFSGCSGLTTVKVNVTDMAAFCNNQVIGQIKSLLNKPVMLIDGEGNEIAEYVIPDGVETISENAFANCKGLTSVTIPSSVTSIGNYAFYYCSGLTSVTIPEGVTSIGDYAFYYCSGLTSVTIPEGVTSIGDYAFYWCTGLTSVTIPSSVTSIGKQAFYHCSGLTSVTIHSSVTSIGDRVFACCDGLTAVKVDAEECAISDGTFSTVAYNNAILYVPVGRLAWYKEATGWKNFQDIREADRVYADNVTTVNGVRLPLSIQMDNTETAAGFQFVLNLPEDVTVVENNGSPMITLSERSNGLELMVTKLSSQRYLIAALSMGFEEIEGTEGAIVDVTISIPRVVRAGEYAITLKDITISTADGHSLTPSDYTVTMTVDENTFGDVNNDGVVNVTDALAIVNHVLNKPVRIFVEANADINQDGNINFTDALNLMRLILSSSANGASPALFDTEEQQAPVIPETQELEPM